MARMLRYERHPEPPDYLKWTYAFVKWTVSFHWPTGLWLEMVWDAVTFDDLYGVAEGRVRVVWERCASSEEWEGEDPAEEEYNRAQRRDFAETHYYLEQWEKRNYQTAYDFAVDLLEEGVQIDEIMDGVG